jgi:hypothetical protein
MLQKTAAAAAGTSTAAAGTRYVPFDKKLEEFGTSWRVELVFDESIEVSKKTLQW